MASEITIAREVSVKALNAVGSAERRETRNVALYRQYADNPDYKDVYFDAASGGMMAVHKGHNWEHGEKDTKRYFGNMTKEDLEKEFAKEVVRMGGSAIMQDESRRRANGNKATALDVVLNGTLTDIRSVTEHGSSYKNQLNEKDKQLTKWNHENPNRKARTITLYFHDPSMFSEDKMRTTIDEVKKYRRNYRRVMVVVKGEDKIRTYRV